MAYTIQKLNVSEFDNGTLKSYKGVLVGDDNHVIKVIFSQNAKGLAVYCDKEDSIRNIQKEDGSVKLEELKVGDRLSFTGWGA